ncbi:MAG TPA: exodeoxyribonuclease VII large subunit [Rhodospirillales bacterium]|jgi:exodeoxyribonuclease VII large subunit|nr:exodeoxyribonuclease VII large subunit [Rhodospirillales bacterium]
MIKPPSSIDEDTGFGLDGDQGPAILTVTEISALMKRTIEEEFGRVRVQGEISGFKRAASGHLYFKLKDDKAVLDGVCWRGTAERLGVSPEDGMEVVATGRLTTYPARSNYQIVVDSIQVAGEGALLKLLEERRKKLAAKGLFDIETKKELPFIPNVIGVVTSETGAVFRDILHRLDDRFPRHVVLWPVTVQGNTAAAEITAAIKGFNALGKKSKVPRPDVLIVARGGGSLEDLMAFNEESVVRAAHASTIPLISAVGHETDTTLIDFAADQRAPTPSAAAEMAVPVRADLVAQVEDGGARLIGAVNRVVMDGRGRLDGIARGLPDLGRLVEDFIQRLDDWTERLGNAVRGGMKSRHAELAGLAAAIPKPQQRLEHAKSQLRREVRALKAVGKSILGEHRQALRQASALMESYSYQRVLERGFVLVADRDDKPVVSVKKLSPGSDVTMRFHDGRAEATVDTVDTVGGGSRRRKKKPPAKRKPDPGDDPQGSLL